MIRALVLVLFTSPATAEQLYARYAFDVSRVIDGDTIEGDLHDSASIRPQVRIRLDCIQSPESRGRDKTPEGALLTGLVRHWIEGRRVYISHLSSGGFGRILARVHVPGWSETLSQRLHRLAYWPSPLYRGSQTNGARIAACVRRMTE